MLLFDLNFSNFFVFSVAFFLLLIIIKKIRGKPKDMKIIEKWGEYLPSKTGISWGVPRVHSSMEGQQDSRSLLEKYGFTVLGIANEVLYRVEPPANWRMEDDTHLHSSIYNEDEVKVLSVFIKNDIMNPSDYRGHISVTDGIKVDKAW